MKPITFSCNDTLPLAPDDIARQSSTSPTGPTSTGTPCCPASRLRSSRSARPASSAPASESPTRTGRATSRRSWSGSPTAAAAQMKEFSPPLSRLATGFEESWAFERVGNATRVTRTFELHPKSAFARPALWLISLLLRRAIARHLRQMRDLGQSKTGTTQRERDGR